jgi:hypothetical protein
MVRAIYEQRPPEAILHLAAEAESVTTGAPAASLPGIIGGKAQALAVVGRAAEAETELERLRDVFGQLPPIAMYQGQPVSVWTEDQLRHTESLVYSHLGRVNEADDAQRRAMALYPSWYLRGPVQIELHRALCWIRNGDVLNGIRHAQAVIDGLPREQHSRPIIDLGERVLAAVPRAHRDATPVAEFRGYLRMINPF